MTKFCGWCGAALEGVVCGSCGTSSDQPRLEPPRPVPSGWGFGAMAGLSGVALVATLAMGGFVVAKQTGMIADDPQSAIGVCLGLASAGDGSYEEVACSDQAAGFRIVTEVDETTTCPDELYFELEGGAAYCTEVVTH